MNAVAFIFAVVAFASRSAAMSTLCLDLPAVDPFDVSNFTGTWYQQFGLNLPLLEGSCVQATYSTDNDSDVINVDGSYRSLFDIKEELHGSAVFTNSSSTQGKFNFTLNTEYFGNIKNTFSVIATDYDNYAVFYSCSEEYKLYPEVTSWVVTRNKALTQDLLALIQTAMQQVAEEDGPSFSEFTRTSQEFCF